MRSQLTSSFTLRALMSLCPLSSSQPSYHRSTMWHLILWTPHPQWSPKHLKLVTVYVLVLLVSLSFASRQSRPFKHQIDNRSKYDSQLMQCDGDPVAPGTTKDQGQAARQSSTAKPCGCFYGKMVEGGPALQFPLLRAYTDINLHLIALNLSREILQLLINTPVYKRSTKCKAVYIDYLNNLFSAMLCRSVTVNIYF